MRFLAFAAVFPLAGVLALPAASAPVAFLCDDGKEITADIGAAGTATVIREDKTWSLPARSTDSGTSYMSEGVEFWTEGSEAILTVDGVTAQCILRPAAE
jgi:membrane-bound inhibitor of C-type lysozyme